VLPIDAKEAGVKSILLLLLLLATFPACAAPEDNAEITAISQVLDRFHASAAKADGAAYFDLFAPDAIFVGTDASERWTVDAFRAYALPLFAKGNGWTYVPRQRHVTLARIACGCVAWFDELLDNAHYGTSRGTGMMTLTPAGWKIEQYALTFPIPNDLAADMTAKIKTFEARKGKAHR
jgi:hypothetical protein